MDNTDFNVTNKVWLNPLKPQAGYFLVMNVAPLGIMLTRLI